jgi:hypothetical protein
MVPILGGGGLRRSTPFARRTRPHDGAAGASATITEMLTPPTGSASGRSTGVTSRSSAAGSRSDTWLAGETRTARSSTSRRSTGRESLALTRRPCGSSRSRDGPPVWLSTTSTRTTQSTTPPSASRRRRHRLPARRRACGPGPGTRRARRLRRPRPRADARSSMLHRHAGPGEPAVLGRAGTGQVPATGTMPAAGRTSRLDLRAAARCRDRHQQIGSRIVRPPATTSTTPAWASPVPPLE